MSTLNGTCEAIILSFWKVQVIESSTCLTEYYMPLKFENILVLKFVNLNEPCLLVWTNWIVFVRETLSRNKLFQMSIPSWNYFLFFFICTLDESFLMPLRQSWSTLVCLNMGLQCVVPFHLMMQTIPSYHLSNANFDFTLNKDGLMLFCHCWQCIVCYYYY